MDTTTAKQHIFAMLDTDGDGSISQDEYLARPARVAAATGRPAHDPLVVAAHAAHERVYASMDADADGRVTLEEYAAWAGGPAFDEVCRPALGSLFDLADADADGHLDRTEFARLREVLGNPPSGAEAAFDALDTDGDSRVSRDEYLASIRAYVVSSAPTEIDALYAAPSARATR
ncbi:EF-hand domain-containing protein [Streptomyces spectabilis]|uniref:EF-hand domain-containing protein n=1 Tax=Streptomyces spectabilis TaxID=68270 RepID=A0A516R1K6_STRST|nr:EF-hand domain-containing protein [Streptomyces spectabilis]QDQ09536.1 EF-hand domain-containing protein [Streptomyces spectabilis]